MSEMFDWLYMSTSEISGNVTDMRMRSPMRLLLQLNSRMQRFVIKVVRNYARKKITLDIYMACARLEC
jgi:hypothetical protein